MEDEKIPYSAQPSNRGLQIAVIALICLIVISLGYAIAEHGSVAQLSSENRQANAQLAQTENQIQALDQKLESLKTQAATNKIVASPRRPMVVARRPIVRYYHPRPAETPWKKVEAELAEHQREIAETQRDLNETREALQGNLNSTANQLNGKIAKNHAELVALEKLGLRNYYEFDVGKSKIFQREGPISLKLRKANVKHQFANLQLIVNDRELTQKHVNLYSPVLFYPEGSQRPVQLVINGIFKNEIRGYVSAPKYKRPELAANNPSSVASSNAVATNPGVTAASPEPTRAQTPTPVALRHRPGMEN